MDYYTGLLNLFDGVLYGDMILAILFIVVSVVLAKVLYKVIEKIFKALTSKTRLQGNIELIKKLERPIVVGIILCGIYFALITLEFLVSYRQSIDLVFTVIGVIVGTYVAIKIANVLLDLVFLNYTKVTRKALDETFVSLFGKVLSGVIIIIGLMFLLISFGVEITPLIASLGIGGIAVALALQDTLSSFFAGTYLVTDRSIKLGDYIELENGLNGWVVGIGWRSTKIKTLPNNMVIIPNSKLAQSIVTNYSAPQREMSVVVKCGVAYGSDLEKVEKVTFDTAKKILQTVQGGVKEFTPFIRFNEFGDSNINFAVILRAQTFVDQYALKHEFVKELTKAYKKNNIEISWPVRKVYMAK